MTTTDTAREIVIEIPMAPPAELSPNARRRGNVWAQREATHYLRTAGWAAALRQVNASFADVVVPYLVTIHEHVIWPKSKGVLPDPDALPTYCKAALDGIVDAGIIAGDSAKHVASVTASQEKGTDTQGRIVVTITVLASSHVMYLHPHVRQSASPGDRAVNLSRLRSRLEIAIPAAETDSTDKEITHG